MEGGPVEKTDIMSKNYWGPRIWRILHTLSCAPSMGKTKNVVLGRDERADWLQLLKAVGQLMPCDRCKQHYREWFREAGILKECMYVPDLGEYLRGAIYDLHCSANVDQGREPTPVLYVDLSGAYPPTSITPIVKELEAVWVRGLEMRIVPIDPVRAWRRCVLRLSGMYGLA
jgi:hypothetical protein